MIDIYFFSHTYPEHIRWECGPKTLLYTFFCGCVSAKQITYNDECRKLSAAKLRQCILLIGLQSVGNLLTSSDYSNSQNPASTVANGPLNILKQATYGEDTRLQINPIRLRIFSGFIVQTSLKTSFPISTSFLKATLVLSFWAISGTWCLSQFGVWVDHRCFWWE